MSSFRPRFLAIVLPAIAVGAAFAATTRVSSEKPIVNFRLPAFTAEGHRAYLIRASEGRILPGLNVFDVKELNLSIFSGKADGRIETLILSPAARVQPAESLVTGDSTIRVIHDDFEATGSGWSYSQKEKTISIRKHVRVVLHSQIRAILQ